MSTDLNESFKRIAEGWVPPEPDVELIRKRGRRILWARRIEAGLLSLFIVVAGMFGGPRLLELASDENGHDVGSQGLSGTPQDHAASFAIRAVAGAGLIDLFGDVYDYVGIEREKDGWTATFRRLDCGSFEGTGVRCPRTEATANLTVARQGNLWVVTNASRVPKANEATLLAYSEIARKEPGHIEQVTAPGAGLSAAMAEGWSQWTGPIPAEDAYVVCTVEIIGRDGDVLRRFPRRIERQVPTREAQRDGNVPWGMETVGIPNAQDALGARQRCSTYKWRDAPWAANGTIVAGNLQVYSIRVRFTHPTWKASRPVLARIDYAFRWRTDRPKGQTCAWRLYGRAGKVIARQHQRFRPGPGFPPGKLYWILEISEVPESVHLTCSEG